MNGNILTDESILKGMSCVGRPPLHQRHCYLECNTSGQTLGDIDSLGNFPNLMYIDISDNQITTLKSLSFIPMLVQLNAR